MYEKNAEFSQEAAQQLELAQQAVREMLEKTRAMFDDIRQIQEVYAYHQVVSELLDRLREKHIERLKSGERAGTDRPYQLLRKNCRALSADCRVSDAGGQ